MSGQPDITWRETWPGEGHEDYVGYHGEIYVGRVYKRVLGGFDKRLWQWNVAWGGPHRQGNCWSRREACMEVEDRYAARLAEGLAATP